ncbi:MAG: response regulator [Candidatus Gastranaerophilales bacterium]|nr:response regulator [Candidatus Gastranaerophilales bacterium]
MNNNKGTILIAEDNLSNMKLLKDILGFQGYKIIEAYDGKTALELTRQNKDVIDLILMDLQLPEMDGIEVIKLIKSDDSTKKLPVVVISAHAMEIDMKRALKAGCNNYITKPINVESFIEKINAFFRHNTKL